MGFCSVNHSTRRILRNCVLLSGVWLASLWALPVQAAPVAQDILNKVAANFLANHVAVFGNWNGSKAPTVANIELVRYDGAPVAYNVTISPSGHLLMAYDDDFSPVILYSATSGFKPENVSSRDSIESWIIPATFKNFQAAEAYKATLTAADYAAKKAASHTGLAWRFLNAPAQSFKPMSRDRLHGAHAGMKYGLALESGQVTASAATAVAPLMSTTWSQGQAYPSNGIYTYNYYTPGAYGAQGYCNHTVTGCVATATAQIMKYWNWPASGTGSHSYSWNGQTLTASFAHTYDWANMPNALSTSSTTAQMQAVGRLMADVGVAAEMEYGCSGSGAWPQVITAALTSNFGYRSGITEVKRSQYTASNFFNILKAEIDASRPMLFTMYTTDNSSGHAVVMDGYQITTSNLAHINLGWGGSYDGYYDISNNWSTGYTWSATSETAYTNISPLNSSQYALTVSTTGAGTGTVTSSPAGINCGSSCSTSYSAGTTVTLSATPGAGSIFAGWGGACSGTGACTVTMSSARSVTASFSTSGSTLLSDGFESGGWAQTQVSGTSASWILTSSSSSPSATAHGGSSFADFNSYSAASGHSARLYRTASFAIPATYSSAAVSFWVYHDTGYAGYTDQVQLQVSTNGSTWTSVGSPVLRYDGSTGWKQVSVDLSAYIGQSSIQIGFLGTSDYGNNLYVDDVLAIGQGSGGGGYTLTVSRAGTGSGTVTSSPAGINCGSTCSANFNSGTNVTLTATPAANTTFTGWSGACSGTGSCIVSMSAAKSVTATFSLANYAVTGVANPVAGGSVSCTSPVAAGSTTTCSITTNAGYALTNASGCGGALTSGTNVYVTGPINAACTVTANYISTIPLSVSKAGTGAGVVTSTPAGINCGSNCTAGFTSGTSVVLTATANAGSVFSGWSGACSGTGTCTVSMVSAKNVTATFTQLTYAVTGIANPLAGGNVSCPSPVAAGATTTCSITANPGYAVSSVTGCSGTLTPATNMYITGAINAACTVTANFVTAVPLSVSKTGTGTGVVTSVPTGIDCGSICTASFDPGTFVTLTATAGAGSVFAGWSGACSGTGTCSITLASAANVTATFNTATSTVLYSDSFESGGWIQTQVSGTAGSWRFASSGNYPSASPHAGATLADFNSYSSTSGSATRISLSTGFNIPASYTAATATFWVYHDLGYNLANDRVQFQVSTNGTTWTNVGSVVPRYDGSTGWKQVSVNLTPYIGQSNVRIGFLGTSAWGNDIYVDDLVVSASGAPVGNYTLTVARAGTGTGTVTSSPAGINCGATCSASFAAGSSVTLAAVSNAGSSFIGWGGACSGTGTCVVTMSSARSVTATFTSGTGTTLFSDGFEGTGWVQTSVTGATASWTLTTAGSYPTVSPHSGAKLAGFNSWAANAGDTALVSRSTGFAIPAGYSSAAASFWVYHDTGYPTANDRVQLQVSTNGVNWTSVGSAVSRYDGSTGWKQATVDLSAYIGQSSVRLGFLGISAWGNNLYMDDVQVVAQGAAGSNYTLSVAKSGSGTVTSSPSGINCGTTCSASYASGRSVALTATPASGSAFTGWSGACSGTGTCNVTMTSAASVSAAFSVPTPQCTAISPSAPAVIFGSPSPLLTATCTNSPTAYIWKLNGATLSTCTGATCSVPAANLATAAVYSVTVTAKNAGGVGSQAASATISVAPASQTIGAITFSPSTLAVGGTTTASATASSGLPVVFTSATPTICTVSSRIVTGVTVGTCTIAANQAGNGNYAAAPAVTRTIAVNPAIPVASLNPLSLTFSSQAQSTTSAVRTVTLANTGTGVLTISSITSSGDYSQGNTCGGSLAVGANCTIGVTFTPTAIGTRTGNLTVTDNASGSPRSVSLSGTGTVLVVFALNVTNGGHGSVSSNPAGIVCGGVCSSNFTSGTSVALTATPDAGYVFAGWGGACSGFGACSVTMNAAKSVTASFAAIANGYAPLAAGGSSTVAVKPDGGLWAWGANSVGQLGDGTATMRSSPVPTGTGYAAVAVGSTHAVALKSDGSLWAWGSDASGQLGDGVITTAPRINPVQVGTGYAAVAAGGYHTIALKSDGSLWAWGSNSSGQLGTGTTVSRARPVQIGVGYKAVGAGAYHSVALKKDGSLWAWGQNSNGQLGVGSTGSPRLSPVQVGTGYAALAAGGYHTIAVKSNASLWSWGSNATGQLGNGTTISRASPMQIGVGYKAVGAGSYHSIALKNDGSLWAWGQNSSGQLGDGTTTLRRLPVNIGAGYGSLAVGGYHAIALKSDGSLWAWGQNTSGQLGDGTTSNRLAPKQIANPW